MTKILIFQDLLYVVPFVAKILESCIDSKVGAALMFVSHLYASMYHVSFCMRFHLTL